MDKTEERDFASLLLAEWKRSLRDAKRLSKAVGPEDADRIRKSLGERADYYARRLDDLAQKAGISKEVIFGDRYAAKFTKFDFVDDDGDYILNIPNLIAILEWLNIRPKK